MRVIKHPHQMIPSIEFSEKTRTFIFVTRLHTEHGLGLFDARNGDKITERYFNEKVRNRMKATDLPTSFDHLFS